MFAGNFTMEYKFWRSSVSSRIIYTFELESILIRALAYLYFIRSGEK